MKKIFLFLFYSGYVLIGEKKGNLYAQGWEKTYSSGEAQSVIQTIDGGYIIGGTILIKTNSIGDTLWTKNIFGHSVQQTADSGYIVVKEICCPGAGAWDIYLTKTDQNGELLWSKALGGPINDGGYAVQQTADGGFIVTGYTDAYGAGGYVYLLKADSNGTFIWSKTFNGISGEGHSVQQTKDGGYILGGWTNSYGAGGYDIYLAKTNSIGGVQWMKTFGGAGYDRGYAVRQTSDNGYIVAGICSTGIGNNDAILIKTDSNGDTIWTKKFGGVNYENAYSVQQTTDEGYILVGNTSSFGAGSSDVFLVKTNSDGDKIWIKTFGGIFIDYGKSVQQTVDKGYIIAGKKDDDIYLIKTDSLGNLCYPSSLSQSSAICFGDSLSIGSNVYYNSGIYIDTLASLYGCDSIVTTILTVNPLPNVNAFSIATEICNGDSISLLGTGANSYLLSDSILNGQSFIPAQTTTYIVIGTDTNNCSDTASITITVNPLPVVIPFATSTNICQGEAVSIMSTGAETYQWSDGISNGMSFSPTSTNTYTVIGTDTNYCSDTAFITITVNPIPHATLSLDGVTLTANQAQANYQWLNCDDEFSEIPGATEQSYTPVENGNYAVVIDLDACVDTSECISVTTVSVADFTDGVEWIRVFPNPSPGIFSIHSSEPISSITITNLMGEKVFEQESPLSAVEGGIPIRLTQREGIYFLRIISEEITEIKKILIY